jgi:hypothetical protein
MLADMREINSTLYLKTTNFKTNNGLVKTYVLKTKNV